MQLVYCEVRHEILLINFVCFGLQTTKEPEGFLGITKLARILSKCTTCFKFKSDLLLTSQNWNFTMERGRKTEIHKNWVGIILKWPT
jgi:hypothetical protein